MPESSCQLPKTDSPYVRCYEEARYARPLDDIVAKICDIDEAE